MSMNNNQRKETTNPHEFDVLEQSAQGLLAKFRITRLMAVTFIQTQGEQRGIGVTGRIAPISCSSSHSTSINDQIACHLKEGN